MSKHIKQYTIIIFSSIFRGIIFLAKKLGKIFLILWWPINKVFKFTFRYLILPIYNLLYLTKKAGKESFGDSTNKLVVFFTHRYWLYILVFILSIFILTNNFKIKTAAAEDLGKKSLLYQIAQGDEFEQDIVEEMNIISDKQGRDKLALKETAEIDFLEPEQASLTKDETVTSEIDESTLQDTSVTEGLAGEALTKTSSPATFTIPKAKGEVQEYVVQGGDTISSIATKFKVSINTILWANDLSGLSIIRPGDKLTVMPTSGVLHKIKKGDTISAIAKKYSVEQDKVLSYNKLVSDSQLQIGQLIIVPDGEIERTYARSTGGFASVFKSPSDQKNAGGFIWPTVGRSITQYYHWRHHAIDVGGRTGTPIYAALDGKVSKAGWATGYGYHVIIDHGGGRKTLYAHLSKMYVKRGEQVTQGAAIGALGSTGWSTGPHLHFEIIISGTKVNPLSYL